MKKNNNEIKIKESDMTREVIKTMEETNDPKAVFFKLSEFYINEIIEQGDLELGEICKVFHNHGVDIVDTLEICIELYYIDIYKNIDPTFLKEDPTFLKDLEKIIEGLKETRKDIFNSMRK